MIIRTHSFSVQYFKRVNRPLGNSSVVRARLSISRPFFAISSLCTKNQKIKQLMNFMNNLLRINTLISLLLYNCKVS